MLRRSQFTEAPEYAALGLDSITVRVRDRPLTSIRVKIVR
jgi:hypothetical protein